MRLADLIADDMSFDPRHADVEIAGLVVDSRAVKPGTLFAAMPGTKVDGLSFVPQALAAGAVAILAERAPDVALPTGVALVTSGNVRRALARMAARFYPRQPATIAAVTGTSGKTSVAAFTRQIWARLGHQAASIGTVGVVSPNGQVYGSLTTPDPIELHRTLDELARGGVTHLALEASSHGLDQFRLDGVAITVAGFTNITRDHLDYHGTFESYRTAKQRLFDALMPVGGAAVLDVDHEHADAFVAAAAVRGLGILTVGARGAGLKLVSTRVEGLGQTLVVEHRGKSYTVRLPLVGTFQVENALVAAGMAIMTGSDPAAVFAALEHLEGAKGRLERAGLHNGAPIFVDYAHKPDALAKALDALRPFVSGRLVLVFGCGGDRDAGKRPIMGAIAVEKADVVIVTDDNPRSEEPAAIRAQILAAAPGAREIGDRRLAIRTAIADLRKGDVLLVAGKGHETGQIVGSVVLPFSDHEAVAETVAEMA
jgi:UDP-N-acetylmuramoyl-L-alanyl-D-glutamate--2,6-diaminopimelate ligase